MLKLYLEKLMLHRTLLRKEIEQAINIILENKANVSQIAAFLVLLRSKTESVNEILGIIDALQGKMQSITVPGNVLDIVGTGGDRANTVNISTAAAILAAACGARVAKHGNRAVSSQCGAADVLQALGVNIDLTPEQVTHCINEIGIGFCFSPHFHPAMQYLRNVRKELAVPTTFNILGPLLNPARTQYNLIGVYDPRLLQTMADLFLTLGVERTLIVHGHGLDELSCLGASEAILITRSTQEKMNIDPKNYGFKTCTLAELQGGDPHKNAELLLDALSGQPDNAMTQTIIFNVGVALWIYGKYASIDEGILVAREKLKMGEGLKLLTKWKEFSNSF